MATEPAHTQAHGHLWNQGLLDSLSAMAGSSSDGVGHAPSDTHPLTALALKFQQDMLAQMKQFAKLAPEEQQRAIESLERLVGQPATAANTEAAAAAGSAAQASGATQLTGPPPQQTASMQKLVDSTARGFRRDMASIRKCLVCKNAQVLRMERDVVGVRSAAGRLSHANAQLMGGIEMMLRKVPSQRREQVAHAVAWREPALLETVKRAIGSHVEGLRQYDSEQLFEQQLPCRPTEEPTEEPTPDPSLESCPCSDDAKCKELTDLIGRFFLLHSSIDAAISRAHRLHNDQAQGLQQQTRFKGQLVKVCQYLFNLMSAEDAKQIVTWFARIELRDHLNSPVDLSLIPI